MNYNITYYADGTCKSTLKNITEHMTDQKNVNTNNTQLPLENLINIANRVVTNGLFQYNDIKTNNITSNKFTFPDGKGEIVKNEKWLDIRNNFGNIHIDTQGNQLLLSGKDIQINGNLLLGDNAGIVKHPKAWLDIWSDTNIHIKSNEKNGIVQLSGGGSELKFENKQLCLDGVCINAEHLRKLKDNKYVEFDKKIAVETFSGYHLANAEKDDWANFKYRDIDGQRQGLFIKKTKNYN